MQNLQRKFLCHLKLKSDVVGFRKRSSNFIATILLALGLPFPTHSLIENGDSNDLSDHPMCGIPTGGQVSNGLSDIDFALLINQH